MNSGNAHVGLAFRGAVIAQLVVCSFLTTAVARQDPVSNDRSHALAISLPAPISDNDIRWFGEILVLGDEQWTFFDSLYEDYEQGIEKINKEDVPGLRALALEAGAAFTKEYSLAAATLHEEFVDAQRKAGRKITDLDEDLFGRLEAGLSELQLERLARVRMARDRMRCFPLYVFVNAAQIDLTALFRNADLEIETLQAMDPVMAEYELAATPHFVQLRRTLDDNVVKQVWAVVDSRYTGDGKLVDPNSAEARARADAYFATTASLFSESARLQKRICDVNLEYFEKAIALVPAKRQKTIRDEFQRRAFPDVYPDQTDPAVVLDEVLQRGTLAGDDAIAVRDMIQAYRDAYALKNRLMAKENMRWREELARTEVQTGYGEYLEKMNAWRDERTGLNLSILKQIADGYAERLPKAQLDNIATFTKFIESIRVPVDRSLPTE